MKTSKTMNIWKTWSSCSMKAVPKYWWAVWMTLSTGDAAIRCGRLHLQPVVVESSLWQWVEYFVKGSHKEGWVRMCDSQGEFKGIYQWDEAKNRYQPQKMFL